MSTPSSEPDLTFQWPAERGFPYVLFLCVLGSLCAHVATFFLFQVVYPQRVTIPQPAPYVSLLTPSTPENVALLRWIEAEDPALISSDNTVQPPGLAEVRYRPSFADPRTTPLGAPVEKSTETLFPPAVDHLLPFESITAPATIDRQAGGSTVIRMGGPLAGRPLVLSPPLDAPRLATAPMSPTVCLIGVNGEGEVRYQFIQQSSGDAGIDELALAHLHRLRFGPASGPLTWAHVTFAWGADAYAEGAAPNDPPPARKP